MVTIVWVGDDCRCCHVQPQTQDIFDNCKGRAVIPVLQGNSGEIGRDCCGVLGRLVSGSVNLVCEGGTRRGAKEKRGGESFKGSFGGLKWGCMKGGVIPASYRGGG